MSFDPAADGVGDLRAALRAGAGSLRSKLRRRSARLYLGDWFVVSLTVSVAAFAGVRLAGTVGTALAVGTGVTAAAAVAAANSSRPVWRAVGAAFAAVGGASAVALTAFVAVLGLLSGAYGAVGGVGVACVALASFGASLTLSENLSGGRLSAATLRTGLAAVGVGGVLGLRLAPDGELRRQAGEAAVAVLATGVRRATAPPPEYALGTFLVTVGVCALCCRLLLGSLPLERLLPADRREAGLAAVAWVRSKLSTTLRAALLGGLFATVVSFATSSRPGVPQYLHPRYLLAELPAPVGGALVELVGSEAIRSAMLAGGAGALAVVGLLTLVGNLRRGLARTLVGIAAPVAGGAACGALAGAALSDPRLPTLLAALAPESVPPSAVVLLRQLPAFAAANVAVLLALVAFGAALVGLLLLRKLLTLPKRAESAALASVGLSGVAVAAMVADLVVVGLGVTVAALSVWDVGEFAAGLREDLPGGAPTLRTEAVHASGSVLSGVAVAAVVWVVYRRLLPALSPSDAGVAVVGLVVGVLLAVLLSFDARR